MDNRRKSNDDEDISYFDIAKENANKSNNGNDNEVIPASENEVELISDMDDIDEMANQAIEDQKAILAQKRQDILTSIDEHKLPLALKELNGVAGATDIICDKAVWDRVRANTRTPMDMKMLAEAQKVLIQNAKELTQMYSINTEGEAGELHFNLAFGTNMKNARVVVCASGGDN